MDQQSSAPTSPKPVPSVQSGLLASCVYLAEHLKEKELVKALRALREPDDVEKRGEFFTQVMETVRQAGLRPSVVSLPWENLSDLPERLPVVVEFKGGLYRILSALSLSQEQVKLFTPQVDQAPLTRPLEQFRQAWTGGIFLFERVNTALVCFSLIAHDHKLEVTEERLSHEYGLTREELPKHTLLRMAKDHGMRAKMLKVTWGDLTRLKEAWPAMAKMKDGRHMVLVGMTEGLDGAPSIGLYDPLSEEGHLRMNEQEFSALWSGEIYLFKRIYKMSDENQPFSLRWFIPEFLRQKVTFFDIALAVLFIHLIALVTPLFFQIVIDKVLVNQAFTTLQVLGIGMIIAFLVNAALDFLRDYLLLVATNKIDLSITTKAFNHMLKLPLEFFESIQAGIVSMHMEQTTRIREFLSGSLFLTILEASSLFVFLPFLFFYSIKLTAVVLTIAGLITLVIALLIKPFRQRLEELYTASSKRRAMAIETIHGIATVKAMATEPLLRRQWEQMTARVVMMEFRVGQISITASTITRFFEHLMTLTLIWMGSTLVFQGSMSLGALIAFNMLAGRVTSPLVRLVGLIHQYQQAALSVEKLGILMNAKEEWGIDRHGATPSLRGDIIFDRVSFRYAPDLPNVLHDISLTIPAGSMLGIVGPSGSGKTTLTRMLQKVNFPSSGTIRINDCYLNELDTAHLRRRMGVVLQENFLFRASIADNIRAGQSAASREEIIQAAILAGADEFIVNLRQGYDTLLEEGAVNLSGGQRQRLSIARALLTKPDILILDEATSALDPESEAIVRENLADIAKNRTVLVVSHRLSMLKDADFIIVLERGYMVGQGRHEELLKDCELYKKLWHQQMEL